MKKSNLQLTMPVVEKVKHMKFNRRALHTSAISIVLSASIYGCDKLDEIPNSGLDALNDAIQKMSLESSQWRDILKETRERLINEGHSTLANEVSNVASRAASDVGIEVKCYTDFLRDRTREDLIRIRASITKEKLELKPVFCNPTPKSIDMNLSAERRPTIEIAGYNLTPQSMKVFLLEKSRFNVRTPRSDWKQESKVDITNHLSNPSSYLLTLNLGSNGVPLSPNSNKILFELPNGETKSIAVVQPPAPAPKTEYLSRDVRIVGNITVNDSDWPDSDEHESFEINEIVKVTADAGGKFQWKRCVDEVQGYISAQLELDRKTGSVTVTGSAKYYEGVGGCRWLDIQIQRPVSLKIPLNESFNHQNRMKNGDGSVYINLNFINK